MIKSAFKLGIAFVAALLSTAALAAQEQTQILETISRVGIFGIILFVIAVFVGVFIMSARDKRRTPMGKVFAERATVHSVGPDIAVIECVRMMAAKKIGAMIVLDGERLVGIFTERDALNKVLAAGVDPATTKISDVMTPDPFCISSTTSVGEAMELVTGRRFRHLPVVENGKVRAVISSGDLTHFLVKDQMGSEVQKLVDLAARS